MSKKSIRAKLRRLLAGTVSVILLSAGMVSAAGEDTGTFTQGLWRGQDPRVSYNAETGDYYYIEDTVDGMVMFRSKSLIERSGPEERRVMPAGFPLCAPVYIEEMNGVTYNKWYAFGLNAWECDGDPFTGTWTDLGSMELGGWTLDHTVFQVESGAHAGEWFFVWAGGEDKSNTTGFSAENIHISRMLSPTELESHGNDLSDVILFCAKNKGWSGWDVEAPTIVQKDGTITMIYSGTDTKSTQYALGLCVCIGDDPSDPASWYDLSADAPAFSNTVQGEYGTPYGTGVAAPVPSADGTETWMYYHAKLYYDIPAEVNRDKEAWTRIINLSKINWTTVEIEGNTYTVPDLGSPSKMGESLPLPSGDPGVTPRAEYLFEAEHAVPFGTIYNLELQEKQGDDGEPYNLMFEGIQGKGMSLDGCMRHFDWFAAGEEGDGTSGLHFRNLPAAKQITIRAACTEENAGFDILVNGEKKTSVQFTPEAGSEEAFPYVFQDYTIDIEIPQGATVTLQHVRGEHADAAVDYLLLSGGQEGKSPAFWLGIGVLAVLVGGAVTLLATKRSGQKK